MLMIRHAIGSRLLFQTDQFAVESFGDKWKIYSVVTEDDASKVLKFKEELNLFVVSDHEKTWYYSSDAQIEFDHDKKQIVIIADHKTVYPV